MAEGARKQLSVKTVLNLAVFFVIALIVLILAGPIVMAPAFVYNMITTGSTSLAFDDARTFLHSHPGETLKYVVQNAGFVLIALVYLRKCKAPTLLDRLGMGIRRNFPKLLILGIAPDLIIFLTVNGLCLLTGTVTLEEFGITNSGVVGVALSTLLAMITTLSIGVGEEVLYRGCLQHSLADQYGIGVALPVAAAMFVIFHIPGYFITGNYPLLSLVDIIPVALVFGYLFYKTGSLWLCIGLHFMQDFLNYQFMSCMYGNGHAPLFIYSSVVPVSPSAPWLGNWINVIGFTIWLIFLVVIFSYYHFRSYAKPEIAAAGH